MHVCVCASAHIGATFGNCSMSFSAIDHFGLYYSSNVVRVCRSSQLLADHKRTQWARSGARRVCIFSKLLANLKSHSGARVEEREEGEEVNGQAPKLRLCCDARKRSFLHASFGPVPREILMIFQFCGHFMRFAGATFVRLSLSLETIVAEPK